MAFWNRNKLGTDEQIKNKNNNERIASLFNQLKGGARTQYESENYVIDVRELNKKMLTNLAQNFSKVVTIHDKRTGQTINAEMLHGEKRNFNFSLSDENNNRFALSDKKLSGLLLPAVLEIKEHLKDRKLEDGFIKTMSPDIEKVEDKHRYRGF